MRPLHFVLFVLFASQLVFARPNDHDDDHDDHDDDHDKNDSEKRRKLKILQFTDLVINMIMMMITAKMIQKKRSKLKYCNLLITKLVITTTTK